MSKKKNAELSRCGDLQGNVIVDYCQLHSGRNIHGAFYYSICLYLVCDSGYLVCDEKGRFVTGSFQWALCVACSSIFVT